MKTALYRVGQQLPKKSITVEKGITVYNGTVEQNTPKLLN